MTQATSPYFAPRAFAGIAKTIEAAGFKHLYPYHANVPSFGDWGFVLASNAKLNMTNPSISVETRYLDLRNFAGHFVFDKDTAVGDVEVTTLDRPVVLDYYLSGWQHYR